MEIKEVSYAVAKEGNKKVFFLDLGDLPSKEAQETFDKIKSKIAQSPE